MLIGFVMADNTARACSQHAVVTRDVPRHPANGCTLQAPSRVCRGRRNARHKRES